MTLETFLLISRSQTALIGLGFLIVLIRLRNRQKYVQFLGLFFLLSILSDFGTEIFKLFDILNYPSNVYIILSLPALTLIYFYALGKIHRRIFTLTNIIFIIFGIVNLLFFQKSAINSYTNALLSLIIIIYCVYYFFWLIKELPAVHLTKLPMFWINSAFLLYYAGNFFLFLSTSYLINVLNNNLLVYWTLHNILGIVHCLILITGVTIDLSNLKRAQLTVRS